MLEDLRTVWVSDFHETVVNGALLERGHQIWLIPAATVYQKRGRLGWGEVLKDKAVTGGPLQIANTTYRLGLGTHADSVIAFPPLRAGKARFW